MNWCITIATPRGLRHRLQSKNTLKSFITASGVIHALAMFRQRCSLNSSANSRRRLETRVSAIDSTPQFENEDRHRWSERGPASPPAANVATDPAAGGLAPKVPVPFFN